MSEKAIEVVTTLLKSALIVTLFVCSTWLAMVISDYHSEFINFTLGEIGCVSVLSALIFYLFIVLMAFGDMFKSKEEK